MIPFDPEKAKVTSGIRIGVNDMDIKGMKEKEMEVIAELINEVAENINDNKALDSIKGQSC